MIARLRKKLSRYLLNLSLARRPKRPPPPGRVVFSAGTGGGSATLYVDSVPTGGSSFCWEIDEGDSIVGLLADEDWPTLWHTRPTTSIESAVEQLHGYAAFANVSLLDVARAFERHRQPV
jgi:hypothetical protein